ncbi:tetratricopeptide repeat protein [Fibrobacter succinogenes]|uniref:tetratricopeptide repeat protein n=1 Tax=Fibrobacter succinogenes TaxID=833 RepID=UPI00156A2A4C|nr:tetratricopeptide repeat protein [Fibrobacter succinogenes]
MRFFWTAFLIFSVSLWARPINDGNKLFAAGDYAGALEKYMKAREAEPANPLLFYNIGTCQYKLGNFEEAKKELESAVRMPDKNMAAKAAYNLANTHFRVGEKAQEPSARIAAWRESVAYLKKAIDLDNDFENAKKNVEIVQRKLKEELDKQKENKDQNQDQNDQKQPPLSDKAKQVLARALQLCKDGKYAEGKQMLENLIAEDETASQLSGHVQRIDDVIEIKAGRKPKTKIDASNTDNDLEVI